MLKPLLTALLTLPLVLLTLLVMPLPLLAMLLPLLLTPLPSRLMPLLLRPLRLLTPRSLLTLLSRLSKRLIQSDYERAWPSGRALFVWAGTL